MIKFDHRSTEWEELLTSKLQQMLRRSEVSERSPSEVDLGIIVALKSPEFEALMMLDWKWQAVDSGDEPTNYFEGEFTRKNGTIGKAIAARASSMGMSSAAIMTTKLGSKFKPRVLAMIGICAGDKKATNLGDLVVANPTWDYGSGKYLVDDDGNEVFEPSPYPHSLSSRLRTIVEPYEGENEVLSKIRSDYPGDKPETVTRLHVGPFASGAAVVASSEMMSDIGKQHRKLML